MRPQIAALPASKIREVANAGIGRSDVLAFWFGESDEVTPEAVRDAAARSLAAGETFYAHNLGLGELRQALGSERPVFVVPVGQDGAGGLCAPHASDAGQWQKRVRRLGDAALVVRPWPQGGAA